MYLRLQKLKKVFSRGISQLFNWNATQTRKFQSNKLKLQGSPRPIRSFCSERSQKPKESECDSALVTEGGETRLNANIGCEYPESDNLYAEEVQNLLKLRWGESVEEVQKALDHCELSLTDDLVLQVIRRHRSDWKSAYVFFDWVSRRRGDDGYSPGADVYNEILDVLGRMKRFEELNQVLDEMSKRNGLVGERTFEVLVRRHAAAHKVEEAIEIFYKRGEYGLELNSMAFQTLLLDLCRYKHVEAAESLFLSKQKEFPPDIKTRNIILHGWCVLGNVREAKRVWNDIISSRCKPDLFTYGIFMHSLTNAGKLGTAIKLLRAMQERGCNPDVSICNNIIHALCFKKRIPEALAIFGQMSELGCPPNVVTYNSLIKHLCHIKRMEKVHDLLDEMELKKGCCAPDAITYHFLLKSAKKPEEIPKILKRMEKNGCKITADTYNLILRLFMDWNHPQGVQSMWVDMEKNGLGPDQRSYTIMINGLESYGRYEDALRYYNEMIAKGMIPEPRTKALVEAINMKLKERAEPGVEKLSDGSSSTASTKPQKRKRRRSKQGDDSFDSSP